MAALLRELRRAGDLLLLRTQPTEAADTEASEAAEDTPADDDSAPSGNGSGYNERLERFEVDLDGVKKRKVVSIELLCEAESSKSVGRALGLVEARLQTLRKPARSKAANKAAPRPTATAVDQRPQQDDEVVADGEQKEKLAPVDQQQQPKKKRRDRKKKNQAAAKGGEAEDEDESSQVGEIDHEEESLLEQEIVYLKSRREQLSRAEKTAESKEKAKAKAAAAAAVGNGGRGGGGSGRPRSFVGRGSDIRVQKYHSRKPQ